MAKGVSSGFEQKMKGGKLNQNSAPTSAPKGGNKSPTVREGFKKGGKVKGCK